MEINYKYALISPARNEADYIEKTLGSVVNQTLLPQCWIIVDDGSTDATAELVVKYATHHDFIKLIRSDGDADRNFGSKANAVNYAYEQLCEMDIIFDYVGNLDADVSIAPEYYERILEKQEENPSLGIAGGRRFDLKDGRFELVDCASNSVGGPFQLFRRRCFEDIGGYMALPYGGIDAVAEIRARMLGWQVQSFPEYHVYHYRPTGTANQSVWQAKYRAGIRDYTIGYHPLFELLRLIARIKDKPYILGALTMYIGYLSAWLRKLSRPVSQDQIDYLHQEQIQRLKAMLNG